MNKYSVDNPPSVKVGDLLYLDLEDDSGFGIVVDTYKAKRKGKMCKMMKVCWPNAKTRLNVFQDHDINQIHWSKLITYYGE